MGLLDNQKKYTGMSWRYSPPIESDYETYEEFVKAMDAYEYALDNYCEEAEARRRGMF